MKKVLLKLIDLFSVPIVVFFGSYFKKLRYLGMKKLPFTRCAFQKIGVFPIMDHYYEPQFNFDSNLDFSRDRELPGFDLNTMGQLRFLEKLNYAEELVGLPDSKPVNIDFYFNNGSYESGDAEYWYQFIRYIKPKRIFEIGSGNSTLMAIKAVSKNRSEDESYHCKHLCIEPYEMPWLEEQDIEVKREKVETIKCDFFLNLEEDDILFIDSSHIIRPEGDVLYEYLELLPILKKGVIVHIHDIFTPKHYIETWMKEKIVFWNEQYLLEAFLTQNENWEVIGALNHLHHHYYEKLKEVCPYLRPEREPGSFYIRKIK